MKEKFELTMVYLPRLGIHALPVRPHSHSSECNGLHRELPLFGRLFDEVGLVYLVGYAWGSPRLALWPTYLVTHSVRLRLVINYKKIISDVGNSCNNLHDLNCIEGVQRLKVKRQGLKVLTVRQRESRSDLEFGSRIFMLMRRRP